MAETQPVIAEGGNIAYDSISNQPDEEAEIFELKLYRRRWLMIAIFMILQMLVSFQWTELSIINNVLVDYYGVTPTSVEWTSQIFSLINPLVALPFIQRLNKVGARTMGILAAATMCTGTWLKVLAATPNRFDLLMLGQSLVALSYGMAFPMVSNLPALWFGAQEISLAGSLPIGGMQLGQAMGFLLPPRIVRRGRNVSTLEYKMRLMHVSVAAVSSAVLVLMVLFFQAKPRLPPSIAKAVQDKSALGNIWYNLKKLYAIRGYVLSTLIYVLSISILAPLAILLNEVIVLNFPDADKDAGNIGCLLVVCGVIGAALTGRNLDRTKRFKAHAIFMTSATGIAVILFTISIKSQSIAYVYISAALLGTFLLSTVIVTVQICIEATYPVPETVSATMLLVNGDMVSLIMTSVTSFIMKRYGDVMAGLIFVLLSCLSVILALMIPIQFKRQNIERTHQSSSALDRYPK